LSSIIKKEDSVLAQKLMKIRMRKVLTLFDNPKNQESIKVFEKLA
jgi:hypothetical protein